MTLTDVGETFIDPGHPWPETGSDPSPIPVPTPNPSPMPDPLPDQPPVPPVPPPPQLRSARLIAMFRTRRG